jgi:acetyl esterase/lipase
MRLLRVGCLAFGLVPLPALAQDAPQLFAPAPKIAPVEPPTARTIPVVRSTLTEAPVPRPEIRSTLAESVAKPVAQTAPVETSTFRTAPLVRTSLTEVPAPTARPEIRSTLAEPIAQSVPEAPPAPLPRPQYQPPPLTFADGVTAQFDIPYATLPGFRPLTLDIYSPRAQAVPPPIVVFVHGGGWNDGDSRHAGAFADFPRALAGLAAQGYVVASINYRLSQEAHFPAALQDVKSAIRWMRGRAAAMNTDPTRLAVWGASAGGQLAAMAGVTCGVPRFEPEGEVNREAPSDCAEAVIDWYGPSDLQSLAADNGQPATEGFAVAGGSSPEGRYLGCEPAACTPGVARMASPLAFISENAPPFLIQHGSADTEVSPKQSQKLYDALKQKAVPVEIALYPDAGHQFARKGTPDVATVNKAMAKLTAFLAATFPAKTRPQIRRTVAN